MIRDVVLEEGGSVIAVPQNTLQVADILADTINVVDTKFSVHAFRADEQVFQAEVQVPIFSKDMWGYKQIVSWDRRSAYFLSGYDQNERGLSYFMCELPDGVNPTTVDEAYETLKPRSVKVAEGIKRKVKRQGDMFFIKSKGYRPPESAVPDHSNYIHNSNHVAEEAVIDGRLLYVRGTIRHVPSGRRPDHAPLNLGRTHWWLCVRNTVPVVR